MTPNTTNPRFSKKKGPFYYFTQNMHKSFPNLSEDQIYQKALEIWQQMSAEKRLEWKNTAHLVNTGRLTHNDFNPVPTTDKYKILENKRNSHIETVSQWPKEKCRSAKIILISMTKALETDQHDDQNLIDGKTFVIPAEICVSVASPIQGEISHKNFIVKIEKKDIPSGYFSNWKDSNVKYHIPLSFGTEDLNGILDYIEQVIAEHGNSDDGNPVYCFSDHYFLIDGAFGYLRRRLNREFNPNLLILDDLISSYETAFNDALVYKDVTYGQLTNTCYDFQIISCEFHQEHIEMDVCALRMNLKHLYLFFRVVCPTLEIEMAKRHRPIRIFSEYNVL